MKKTDDLQRCWCTRMKVDNFRRCYFVESEVCFEFYLKAKNGERMGEKSVRALSCVRRASRFSGVYFEERDQEILKRTSKPVQSEILVWTAHEGRNRS